MKKVESLLREQRWEEARRVWERLLRKKPNDPGLLVALIRATHASNAYEQTVELCNRILAKHPQFAPALLFKGMALLGLGRAASALQAFDAGLMHHQDAWEWWLNKAFALDQLVRPADAVAAYEQAIRLNPRSIEALNNLGNALQKLQRDEDALQRYTDALALAPSYILALYNRGLVLNRLCRYRQALENFNKVLQIQPDFAPALNDRSLALTYLGRLQDALDSCDRALSLAPGFGQALTNRGVVLNHLGRHAMAMQDFQRAEELLGETAEILTGRALALYGLGDIAAALECHDRAVERFPNSVQCFVDRGATLSAVDRIHDARVSYDKAIELDPACADAHFNRSLLDLGEGLFDSGWRGYEFRWKRRGVEPRRFETVPDWNGEKLSEEQTILVWSEQGVGDELLFASMYPEFAHLGVRCVIECRAKLCKLFRRSFPWATVVAREEGGWIDLLSRCSFHVPAGSLGRFYRLSLDDFPNQNGYLLADPDRLAFWKSRLADLGPGLKVGFSWRSSKAGPSSTSLAEWEPLFQIPGIDWISLQYDECTAELEEARTRFGVPIHRFPDLDYYDDLDELGALMKAIDLVITAPTAVSRQSAALAVPTWQVSFGHEWQRHGTEGYPWLPALARFSRPWNRSWQVVFDDIATQLRAKLSSRRSTYDR